MSSVIHRSSLARFDFMRTLWRLWSLVVLAVAGLSACSVAQSDGDATASTESEALKASHSTGSVHDSLGAPVPAVRIELVDGHGRNVASGVSASDGSYSLAARGWHVPSGTYSLVVTPRAGSGFAPRTFSDQELSKGAQLDVVLVKQVPTTITGRVLDAANNPVANQYACLSGAVSFDCVVTLADGTFTVSAAAGDYTLDLRGNLYQTGDSAAATYHISEDFSAHGFVALGDFKLETYQFRGEVRDANDVPLKGAALAGSPFHVPFPGNRSTTVSFGKAFADANGKFRITTLPFEGRLSTLNTPPGSVSITPGQNDVLIRLPPPLHVTGRLLVDC